MKQPAVKVRDIIVSFDGWVARFAGWIVVVMMLTVSYDVVMRYAFNMPTKWSFEFNRYFLLAVVYLAGAWTLRVGGHINIDILYRRFSGRGQAVLGMITSFLGMVFSGVLTWQAVLFTHSAWMGGTRSSEYIALPYWPIRSLMVVGAGLLCFEFLFQLCRYISNLKPK